MVLGFKENFPDGTPTTFEALIIAPHNEVLKKTIERPKIHSIRKGERWRAGMSIQMAYGVRTKNYFQFNKPYPELQKCISVQDVFMTYDKRTLEVTIDDEYRYFATIENLIANDGLTRERFLDWFFPEKVYEFSGQIIHWTDFKY